MKNKILLITIIFITSIIIYLVIDYMNIMSFISFNINHNFFSIFTSIVIPIYLFFMTYYLINKRINDNEREKKKNKEKYLYMLLLETYKDCKSAIDNYEENVSLIKKIDKKNSESAIINYIKLKESSLFKNNDEIIKLLSEGCADETVVTEYIIIKKLFCNLYEVKWFIDKLDGKNSKEMKSANEVKKVLNKRIIDIKEALDNAIENVNKKMEE